MSSGIAEIKVVGVGGGGGNAVSYMSKTELEKVEFVILNTDKQAMSEIKNINEKHAIGGELTKGLGAGANPAVGREAAEADVELITSLMEGSNMVFITAGMGGGTGTGAAPIVAKCAKEQDILTIAVVTTPFSFEGKKRASIAEVGLTELRDNVDAIIVIPNENLFPSLGSNTKLTEAFNAANDVLFKAVKGVSELITKPGLINIDFADIRTIMKDSGYSMMGIGSATGTDRARDATEQALSSPLLDNLDIKGAKGILVNVSASENMSLGDFHAVGEIIESYTGEDATTVIGTTINPSLGDEIQVTVVATGLPEKKDVDIDSNVVHYAENSKPDDGQLDIKTFFTESDNTPVSNEKTPETKQKGALFKISNWMKK